MVKKKLELFSIYILVSCTTIFFNVHPIYPQPGEKPIVKVYLKDGSVVQGKGSPSLDNTKFVLKVRGSRKKTTYKFFEIDYVKELQNNGDNGWSKKRIISIPRPGTTPKLVYAVEIENGPLLLYSTVNHYNQVHTGVAGTSGGIMMMGNTQVSYYLKDKASFHYSDVGNGKAKHRKFKKVMNQYFGDCPSFWTQEIVGKKLHKVWVVELVKKYNEMCFSEGKDVEKM